MNLFVLTAVWLLAWMLIITIFSFANSAAKEEDEKYYFFFSVAKDEMIADGNNLFATGFMYLIGNIICRFINIPILEWIIMIIGILFCIPPILSCIFQLIPQAFRYRDTYISIMTITGFLSAFIPSIMAVNIYFLI